MDWHIKYGYDIILTLFEGSNCLWWSVLSKGKWKFNKVDKHTEGQGFVCALGKDITLGNAVDIAENHW